MTRLANIEGVKNSARGQQNVSRERYERAIPGTDYLLLRWIASMTPVEVYAIWERYAEKRLTIALKNHPEQFFTDNGIKGMKTIPVGLAAALVRCGIRYFDFRSSGDSDRQSRSACWKSQ